MAVKNGPGSVMETIHSSPVSSRAYESTRPDTTKDSELIANRPISSSSSSFTSSSPGSSLDDHREDLKDERRGPRRFRPKVEYEVEEEEDDDQP